MTHQKKTKPHFFSSILTGMMSLIFMSAGITVAESADGILLQQIGSPSALGLLGICDNTTSSQWIDVAESSAGWLAIGMDQQRILFSDPDTASLACFSLDENGAPTDWIEMNFSIPGSRPVGFEGNNILTQGESGGALTRIEFDDAGNLISETPLWESSLDWQVCGMDANRLVLVHTQTRHVAILACNPKTRLFRPYKSFILSDGWTVRDLACNQILIQQDATGALTLVELGDGYRARKFTELTSPGNGWRAVAATLTE